MISVCVASFNGEKYIRQQIKSILEQLDYDDEIIVVDSGSTDATTTILNSFKDTRIRIYPFDNSNINGGEFKIINKIRCAFFYAITLAKGDTVYLSDQDDIWNPNKISECEQMLKKYDVVCHDCDIVDNSLTILGTYKRTHVSYFYNFINPPFQGCCMAFNRKVVNQIKFCLSLLIESNLSHDHLIGFLSMIFNGKNSIQIIPKPLIKYRRHNYNASSTGSKSTHSLKFKIQYRINELRCYFNLWNKKKEYQKSLI